MAEHLLAVPLTATPVCFRRHSHLWVTELRWPNDHMTHTTIKWAKWWLLWWKCDPFRSFVHCLFCSSCNWEHKACWTNQQPEQSQDIRIHWCLFMVAQTQVNNINRDTFQCGGGQVALASLNIGCCEWLLDCQLRSVAGSLSVTSVNVAFDILLAPRNASQRQ